jgi:hypothetical protein
LVGKFYKQQLLKIKTKNAPTPDASEGVATPPYKTYKTPAIIAKKGKNSW